MKLPDKDTWDMAIHLLVRSRDFLEGGPEPELVKSIDSFLFDVLLEETEQPK
jgi:hypothetical protein